MPVSPNCYPLTLSQQDFIQKHIDRAEEVKGDSLTLEEKSKIASMAEDAVRKGEDLRAIDRANHQALYDTLDYKVADSRAKLDLAIRALEPKSLPQRVGGTALQGLHLWSAWLTGFDLAPIFRQGVTHLPTSIGNLSTFWRALRDPEQAFIIERNLRERMLGTVAKAAGLGVIEEGAAPAIREQAFINTFVEQTKLGATQRGVRVFVNKLRADTFDTYVNSLGGAEKLAPSELANIADFVNSGTGRGSLGGFESSAHALSGLFIGPRFMMSRLQYSLGLPMWKAAYQGNGTVAALMAKEYAKQVIGLGVMGLFAEYAGNIAFGPGTVNFAKTPDDYNFGRLRIGTTQLDITGGLGRPYRYIRALVEPALARYEGRRAERKSGDVALGILRSSLAPLPSSILEANDVALGKIAAADALGKYIVPWGVQDSYNAFAHEGLDKAGAIAALSLIGAGSYQMRQ